MVYAFKTHNAVTNAQRTILRRIPLVQIENAYRNLHLGYSETSVCTDIGINPGIFEDYLQQALEEALWERGKYPL